jgi:hypothetical protein
MKDLQVKKEVLSNLHARLTFTDEEKRVLLSTTDEDDIQHTRIRRER